MLRGFRRGVLGLLVGILVFSSVSVALLPSTASAADENPLIQLERWYFYRGMWTCLSGIDFAPNTPADASGDRSTPDINAGHIVPKNAGGGVQQHAGFGYLALDMGSGDDGTLPCTDGSIFVRGATAFGFNNVLGLVCAMNRAADKLGVGGSIDPSHPTNCEESEKVNFEGENSDLKRALTEALEDEGIKNRPAFNINDNNFPGEYSYGALLYLIGRESLEGFCGNGATLETASQNGGDIGNKDIVSVDIVKSDGTVDGSKPYPIANSNRDENSMVKDIFYNQGGSETDAKDLRCHEMAKMTRDNSAAYSEWAAVNEDEAEDNETTTNPGSTSDSTTTCAIEGIGWLICPTVRVIGAFNDSLFGMINNLLDINPSLFQREGSGAAIYNAWEAMRTIANVAFVIAFLVIIYSQITSAGISNYGIKKLLPRMIIAAILVNISFIVCALAVDLSNILGSSLHDLMIDQTKNLGDQTGARLDIWDAITGWLLAGGIGSLSVGAIAVTMGGTTSLGALALLIPLAIVALIAALTVLFILVAREAFIIILVALSPLAFVAYLLPNTEQWFQRWRKFFMSMLLMYPLIAMLFGGSQLASAVIRAGAEDILTLLISLVVLVIPLFATPLLLKFSGGLIGQIAGRINNPNKGPFDRMKKAGASYANRQRGYKAEDAFARTKAIREGDGGKYGKAGSVRRRAATWVSGIGNENSVNNEQKNQWSEAGKKAEERKYFAERAQNDESFARAVGRSDDTTLVQAYGVQAEREERIKDIKAGTALIDKLDNATVARIAATGEHEGKPASKAVFQAATHRIQDTGSFDERMNSLAFLAANKTGETSERLGMDGTLRGEAAQKSIARGDSKILGAGFGNDLVKSADDYKLEDFGGDQAKLDAARKNEIKGGDPSEAIKALRAAAVRNTEGGAVNAQHLVQGDASTKFLVESVVASGNQEAVRKLREAADTARNQTATASSVTAKIDESFKKLGSTPSTSQQPSSLITPGSSGYSQTGGGPTTP